MWAEVRSIFFLRVFENMSALLLMVGPALVVVNFGYWPQQTLAALGAAAGVWGVIALALYRLLPGMRYELHQTVNMLRRPRK